MFYIQIWDLKPIPATLVDLHSKNLTNDLNALSDLQLVNTLMNPMHEMNYISVVDFFL